MRIKLSWNHFILYSILNHNNTRIGKAQTLGYKSMYRFKGGILVLAPQSEFWKIQCKQVSRGDGHQIYQRCVVSVIHDSSNAVLLSAWYVTFNPNCNIFCLLERVQIPEDENFLDVFVCNIHSTDNICVNLSGEEYSVSILLNFLTGMEVTANKFLLLAACFQKELK